MSELTLEALRTELVPIRSELSLIRARVDGLPLINRSITVLQQDVRLIKVALNDIACTNVTTGEIEAMHEDLSRALAANAELEARLATLERLVQELQKQD